MENHHRNESLTSELSSSHLHNSHGVQQEHTHHNTSPELQYQPPTQFFFLRLPFEIRLQIYGFVIPQNRPIDVSSPRFGLHELKRKDNQDLNTSLETGEDISGRRCTTTIKCEPHYCPQDWTSQNYKTHLSNSIFLLSKQISTEALDVLYGGNIFKLCLDGYDEMSLMENFADTNWRRIKKMLISVKPFTYENMRGDIDEGFWAFMLPRLNSLRIVVDSPTRTNYMAWIDSRQGNEQNKWLVPHLECLGRHLSRRTVVEVDDDDCVQMQQLIKRYLPGEHHKVECGMVENLVLKSRLKTNFFRSCRFYPSSASPRPFGF